jgi:hypothetical protein
LSRAIRCLASGLPETKLQCDNRRVPKYFLGAILLALLSCGGNLHSKEAVRKGVVEHLSNRKNLDLDLSAIDLEITSVAFRENEADATVSFRPKGAPASSAGMQMKYTLERSGNEWKVKSKAEVGGDPHGAPNPHGGGDAPSSLPPGHPPLGQENKK